MNNILPPPGATIATNAFGPFYTHFGIMGDNGLIIHASKRLGLVVEEALSEFTQGASWRHSSIRGNKPANEVISWARSRKGQRWDLFNSNCEHFVRMAHGLPKQCKQMVTTVVSVALFLLFKGK
ncbi:MAG: lecithin retinol acyltransferase family protein [Rhodospirillaceae bacterium]|nr:lecithin retinol acyltransferase family protein [Rhodospirillales bacterium]